MVPARRTHALFSIVRDHIDAWTAEVADGICGNREGRNKRKKKKKKWKEKDRERERVCVCKRGGKEVNGCETKDPEDQLRYQQLRSVDEEDVNLGP